MIELSPRKKLKALCNLKTQKEVARLLAVSEPTINAKLEGRTKFKFSQIGMIDELYARHFK